MKKKSNHFWIVVLSLVYLYLSLPFVIFALGWCKPLLSVPLVLLCIGGILLCIREHWKDREEHTIEWGKNDILKLLVVILIILSWVAISGVGKFSWQNNDHAYRNSIFNNLVNREWPVTFQMEAIDGGIFRGGLIYYFGFWLPSALVGKLFGIEAGYLAQYIWAVVGILLVYALICFWKKKVFIWPILLMVFFSGMDIIGILLTKTNCPEFFFSLEHLEWWSNVYQFSSNTTQLFFVFNQAIPAWLVITFLFLHEKPQNMIFDVAVLIISAVFPAVGCLPFALYFMIKKSKAIAEAKDLKDMSKGVLKHWYTVQNIAAGGAAGAVSILFYLGNGTLYKTFPALQHLSLGKVVVLGFVMLVLLWLLFMVAAYGICFKEWNRLGNISKVAALLVGIGVVIFGPTNDQYPWYTPPYRVCIYVLFFTLEVGVLLWCLYKLGKETELVMFTGGILVVCSAIQMGGYNEFCMRVSIPGLFLLCMLCMQIPKERNVYFWILALVLAIGVITPVHELRRSLAFTQQEYPIHTVEDEQLFGQIYNEYNNFSGPLDTMFWEYCAKK